ncbi:NAD-dependent epimerase/dehydratase family protein [Roseiconus nitratireducens]|uniref:NAD-dependent epimerase/dehydratase family protein n=1 Tax=Roseiconus nitratireducens TaxID=2605748 RepID=A0A5M6CW56_9BACT|nr:NAD-dependent epimerase/dehydratase family protein [Roseiconus nitratireducens]KAA5539323.1 NAD-dependent epimerase/dehydratase family protein [Roseiconus nitratireducens]
MNDDTDILVVGSGYLGQKVAEMAAAGGATVHATTRSPRRFDALSRAGLRPVLYDWTRPIVRGQLPTENLRGGGRVLVAVSYDRTSRHDRYTSQVGGLRRLLAVLPPDTRICYISTTGVYHQQDGRWVDETAPTHPDRLGGRVHLQAEQLLHAMRPTGRHHILRLAGIYGPGRVPRVSDVLAGRPIACTETGFLNLIHVTDAARAVLASWQRLGNVAPAGPGIQSRLYLVADDHPVVRGDFYREIARRCGVAPPRFAAPAADASARMRSESNKRIWNRKMRRDLLDTLTFPDYRCGLADVLQRTLE